MGDGGEIILYSQPACIMFMIERNRDMNVSAE